jgi:hypothetical protein
MPKTWLVVKEQQVTWGRMDAECPVWKGPLGGKTASFVRFLALFACLSHAFGQFQCGYKCAFSDQNRLLLWGRLALSAPCALLLPHPSRDKAAGRMGHLGVRVLREDAGVWA